MLFDREMKLIFNISSPAQAGGLGAGEGAEPVHGEGEVLRPGQGQDRPAAAGPRAQDTIPDGKQLG